MLSRTFIKIFVLVFLSLVPDMPCLAVGIDHGPAFDSSWTDGYVESDGVKIHFIGKKRDQNSPSLLFIPGLSMPGWIFEKQLKHFSQNYSVFAMDPRSQGNSSQTTEGHYASARAKDIKAVVDQLKLQPVVLIGWSLAVSEVVSFLDQFDSKEVVAVVLVDGLVGFDLGSQMGKSMISYWSDFQKDRPNKTKEFICSMFKQPQDQEYLNKLTAASLRTPTNTLMTLAYNYFLQDFRSLLPAIKKPTLIFTINDAWLEQMKEIQRSIPNSRLEIMENAGHALFVDQPEQFNRIVEKFLGERSY